MTTTRDLDDVLGDYLQDGPTELPDRSFDGIRASIDHIQQRAVIGPWRTPSMSNFARLATLGVVVFVLSVVGLVQVPRQSGTGAAETSPSPATSQSPGPLDTSSWTTYTSDRYGFSIGHPADWSEQPADHTWTMADATAIPYSSAAEHFLAPTAQVGVSAWSVAYPDASTTDRPEMSWIQSYCLLSETDSPFCASLESRTDPATTYELPITPVTIDGHHGSLVQFVEDTQAFILVGDRMYVVAVWRPDDDPSTTSYGGSARLLEGYLSTMHLLPGGPAPSSVPSPTLGASPLPS